MLVLSHGIQSFQYGIHVSICVFLRAIAGQGPEVLRLELDGEVASVDGLVGELWFEPSYLLQYLQRNDTTRELHWTFYVRPISSARIPPRNC